MACTSICDGDKKFIAKIDYWLLGPALKHLLILSLTRHTCTTLDCCLLCNTSDHTQWLHRPHIIYNISTIVVASCRRNHNNADHATIKINTEAYYASHRAQVIYYVIVRYPSTFFMMPMLVWEPSHCFDIRSVLEIFSTKNRERFGTFSCSWYSWADGQL